MEKEQLAINAHQLKLNEEMKLGETRAATHSCCGKCRQKDQLLVKSCDKKTNETATVRTDYEKPIPKTTQY